MHGAQLWATDTCRYLSFIDIPRPPYHARDIKRGNFASHTQQGVVCTKVRISPAGQSALPGSACQGTRPGVPAHGESSAESDKAISTAIQFSQTLDS